MIFGSGKKVIGLDIGTSTIKVAELNVGRKSVELVSFKMMPTPEGSYSSGDFQNITSLGSAIQSVISELKSSRKHLCIGMSGTAVIIKKITIPKVDKKILKEQIRFEAEQYIPFDIQNISLEHHVLNSSMAPDTMDVLLIAAQNELILQYGQLGELVGKKSSILDVSGFALANCFEANYGTLIGENFGILNFGAGMTNFVGISNGEIIFCRDIPAGGLNYTYEIHKSMGLSMEEAESMKISAFSNREVPDDVHSIISATNEVVIEETRNSIDFLNATSNGITLSRLFYTGGSSQTHGLMEGLQQATGIPVEQMNVFQKIKYNPKKMMPAYVDQITPFSAIAIGLALRTVGDHD